MPLGNVLGANLARSLTISGPAGGNNAPANINVKISGQQKNVAIVQQLVSGTGGDPGDHVKGGYTIDVVAGGGGGDCYWLPWNSWKAYVGQLQGIHDFFLTPNLTGCGFFVSGNPGNPYVVHANCEAAKVVDFPASGSVVEYDHDLDAARSEYYGHLAASMVQRGDIPDQGLQMLRPDDYGAKRNAGYAVPTSVFGVRQGGNWAIYYNVGLNSNQGITRMLYPNFQSL